APSKLSPGRSRSDPKDLVFLLDQDLTAFVHAGLQVDVVRTTQFASVLVFDIGVGAQGVMSATHVATRGGSFALRNGHVRLNLSASAPINTQTQQRRPTDTSRHARPRSCLKAPPRSGPTEPSLPMAVKPLPSGFAPRPRRWPASWPARGLR